MTQVLVGSSLFGLPYYHNKGERNIDSASPVRCQPIETKNAKKISYRSHLVHMAGSAQHRLTTVFGLLSVFTAGDRKEGSASRGSRLPFFSSCEAFLSSASRFREEMTLVQQLLPAFNSGILLGIARNLVKPFSLFSGSCRQLPRIVFCCLHEYSQPAVEGYKSYGLDRSQATAEPPSFVV